MEDKGQAYYRKLLDQYIDGSISDEDRFILEKRALNDPFLFEALEGYQNKDGSNDRALINLMTKIEHPQKEKRNKRIPLFNYGIAASLVLLLGAGLWMFTRSISPSDSIAINTETESKTYDNSRELVPYTEPVPQSYPETKEKTTIIEEVAPQNQYDSPKAVISSGKFEEELEEGRIVTTSDQNTNAPNAKPTVKTSLINATQKEELSSTYKKEKNEIIVASPSKAVLDLNDEDKSGGYTESEVANKELAAESVVMDLSVKNEQSSAGATLPTDKLMFPRKEYIKSLDDNILVAPAEGISAFKEKFSIHSNRKKRDIDDSVNEVVIHFKLTKEGSPTEFKIVSGEDQDCINSIIAILKYQDNWVTSPPESEVSVSLTLPCK